MSRRGKLQMYAAILKVTEDEPLTRYGIYQKTGLHYTVTDRQVKDLVSFGLLLPCKARRGRGFLITSKGKDFLVAFENIEKLLGWKI